MMIPTATKRTTTTTTTTRRRTMLFFSFVVVATITDSSSFMPIGRVVDAFTVINNNYNHNYNKGIVGSPRHFYSVTTDRIIDKQQQDNNNNWNNPIQLRMTEDFDDDDHDHHDDDDIGDDHHEDEDESDDNSFDDSFDDDGDADDDDDDGIHMSVIDVEVEGDEDEDEDYDDEDNVDDEDEEEEEDEEDDNQRPIGGVQIPLTSEFGNDSTTSSSSSALTKTDDDGDDTTTTTSSSQSSLTTTNTNTDTDTDITVATDKKETDWGSALGQLRNRMDDIESGKSSDPSQQLFRLMSSETPNQVISKFVSSADPNVVQAMSSAITGLLGGLLSSPSLGVEMIVKGSGEKISSLCFQLQMTGYMFRNAEYLIALKDLMDLPNGKQLTIDDYKEAFDRVDTDSSGYIDMSEIRDLFKDAYSDGDSASSVDDDDENNDNDDDDNDDDVPFYEITAFLEFFDKDMDGKVSWDEFSKGLVNATSAGATATQAKAKDKFPDLLLLGSTEENEEGNVGVDDEDDDDDDDDGESIDVTETISGMIEIEMDDGTIIEVDANEYMESLKAEARKLKAALRREQGGTMKEGEEQNSNSNNNNNNDDMPVDIAGYLASRRGDVKSLTEGIKPETVDTMKKLIGFVLEGSVGDVNDENSKGAEMTDREKLEMDIELPGSALKQLALWQLVLGYRLREEEAKGDYVKLLD